MMTKEQRNELLSSIISMYAPRFGRKVTKKAASHLAMTAVECQIENIAGDTYARAKSALSKCGTVLAENGEDGIISGIIFSGAANRNPAFLLLEIKGAGVHVAANAKEGLIKQHTAERAVNAFRAALSHAEAL